MAAKHVLPGLWVRLLALTLWRLAHDGFKLVPASRAGLWWSGAGTQ